MKIPTFRHSTGAECTTPSRMATVCVGNGWTLFGQWFVKVAVNDGCECITVKVIFKHWKYIHKYSPRLRDWEGGRDEGVESVEYHDNKWASVDGNISRIYKVL